ncbi:MAG TPA: alpha/beta hydrolase [Pseudonocardia sp.]|nr:alpha/beta hydrolase [Pseudonocardia sp.]
MITHREIEVNGLRLHLAEAGPPGGPVVLLLHGFPECWYSWRHQLAGLAEAGFRMLAPDQRGYARSDAPAEVERYTILHLVGDAVGVLDAVGAERAVVVGHDWGAPVAWHTALLRPDRVRGVVGLSVPHLPRSPRPVLAGLARRYGEGYYQLYFQTPGPADEELGADPRATFRRMLAGTSGGRDVPALVVPPGGGFLDTLRKPQRLPGWLTEEDLDVYVAEYTGGRGPAAEGRGVFSGGLAWYRNLDRNWELTAPWHGVPVRVPALYLAGEQDMVVRGTERDALVAALHRGLADLRGVVFLPGCGHWTQQERPTEVSAAIVEFAAGLPA